MRKFTKSLRHGELSLKVVPKLPKGAEPVANDDLWITEGSYIVGHSESGHHHVMEGSGLEIFRFQEFLFARVGAKGAVIRHAKSGPDAHEAFSVPPKTVIEIRHAKEHWPDGWRKVVD